MLERAKCSQWIQQPTRQKAAGTMYATPVSRLS